jgi:hypothetical protein
LTLHVTLLHDASHPQWNLNNVGWGALLATSQHSGGMPSSSDAMMRPQAAMWAKSSITQMVVDSCISMEDTGMSSCHFLMYLHAHTQSELSQLACSSDVQVSLARTF